jgi:broad specificity phosphatase PhoE
MNQPLRHLVLVRHGESDGDARRAAWRRGERVLATKAPELEEITTLGVEQCRLGGILITKHIVEAHGITGFDGCYVSSALRSEQSAVALNIPNAVWQDNSFLDERNRGKVRGLHPDQHRQLYPQSFEQMKSDPLNWTPPEGESILEVTNRAGQFMNNVDSARDVLAVTHRDWLWASLRIIERLTESELMAVNTDDIPNAQIIEYTSISPTTGHQAPDLMWKRTANPETDSHPTEWQILPKLAELYPGVA